MKKIFLLSLLALSFLTFDAKANTLTVNNARGCQYYISFIYRDSISGSLSTSSIFGISATSPWSISSPTGFDIVGVNIYDSASSPILFTVGSLSVGLTPTNSGSPLTCPGAPTYCSWFQLSFSDDPMWFIF